MTVVPQRKRGHSTSSVSPDSREDEKVECPLFPRGRTALVVCSCIPWLWVLSQADQSRQAERHWAQAAQAEAHMIESDWRESDAAYVNLITPASQAADLEPGNIHYRHWLNVYRWRSISRTADPNGLVLLPDRAIASARRIAQDLQEALPLCPTFGPTWCVLGQLEYEVLGNDRGLAHLRKSFQLCPNDPTVCLVTGLTDIGHGQMQEGLSKLCKAVQLDGRFYPEVARTCVHDLRSAELALDLAEGQPQRLTQLAGILADTQAQGGSTRETQNRIVDLLTAQCDNPQAPASCFAALGWIHEKRREAEAAIRCFRAALARDYGQVSYHLALARLLAHAGKLEEAMHEANVCLRLSPQHRPAERLIEELAVRPPVGVGTVDPEPANAR